MKQVIFFDLDGTLIETSERHYIVYRDIMKCYDIPITVSSGEFWKHKRKGGKTVELLPKYVTEEMVQAITNEWLERIEQKEYLIHDRLFQETLNVLKTLKNKTDLILVTLRNNRENLLWELNNFGLANFFKEILAGSPINLKNKIKLVDSYIERYSNNGSLIIVGDSEADISTGKDLGILSAASTYGIRSKKFLKKLQPDFYLDSLSEVINVLEIAGYKL